MNPVELFVRPKIISTLTTIILSLVSCASADDKVVFDFNSSQKFLGLGVQLWPSTDHPSERDALLRDLHVRYVRIGFATQLPDEQLKAHMSVGEILAAIVRNQNDNQSTLFSGLHRELSALRVQTHFVFWQVPAPWCNHTSDDVGDRSRINPENLQDYANLIVANLQYAKRFGLVASAIEMVNEPDSVHGTQFTPEQYDFLLVKLRATLDGAGLGSVGIEGPGTSSALTVPAYTQTLEKTGHISILNQLSWHDYDTEKRPEPAGFAGVPLRLLADAHQLPIAITEFSSESPQWERPPFDSGPHTRGENNATDSPDFAVSVVGEVLKLVADGANSLSYWQAEDPTWTQDSFGLLNVDGQRKPVATALQMFSQLVPPGSEVAGPKSSTLGFAAACFRCDHGIIFAEANLSLAPRIISAEIVNARLPNRIVTARQFDSHGVTQPPPNSVAFHGESISANVPPRSVTILLLR
ncbi:MAG: hypothetical protein JO333_00965 [Verrucomicrobia bacterium]|nr:hypothetical protein [Verrucomicrobiota bacterium]